MSSFEELQQYVAGIATDAQSRAVELTAYSNVIQKYVELFSSLTATTQGSSARIVHSSFLAAEKDVLKAAQALLEASKAGMEWSGASQPVLKRVLKPGGRG